MNRSTLQATAVATTMVLAAASLTAATVLANDSAINHGAHGPQPLDVDGDRESEIRMVEEELISHLGKWRTRVEARFVFENTRADATVRQLSGFPIVEDKALAWLAEPDVRDKEIARN